MGETNDYRCPGCGYTERNLDEGPSELCMVEAFSCPSCRRIVPVITDVWVRGSIAKELNAHGCPHCDGIELDHLERTGEGVSPCPRCGDVVDRTTVALWD